MTGAIVRSVFVLTFYSAFIPPVCALALAAWVFGSRYD